MKKPILAQEIPENLKVYFKVNSETPAITDARCSVRFGNRYRLEKARQQYAIEPMPIQKVITTINEFLRGLKMEEIEDPRRNPCKINYKMIQKHYKLKNLNDLIWLKFDSLGHIGAVCASADVNLNIPPEGASTSEYCAKTEKGEWRYTTSGIILHSLGEKWDDAFVLIFPLVNIPIGLTRSAIERAVGNFLIARGAAILDFYSHEY